MLKRLVFLFLVILAGCGPAPKEKNVTNDSNVKPKPPTVKPSANPWTISSFAPKEGEMEGKKFVRFVTEGVFSDSTKNNSYLYAEVIVNKTNAGIFLHELKKSNPAEKFSEPVQIKMTKSDGQELQLNSTKRWNSSGGILIESNNNDYSQFRIYLLESKGKVTVEIRASGTKTYSFNINASGFSDSFIKL